MELIAVQSQKPSTNFGQARGQAAGTAAEKLSEPVIIAWKDDTTGHFGPEVPGGSADRWHDYGESHGGKLEVTVGDDFHFIFSEASEFHTPELALSNLTAEDGTTFLCLTAACTEEDRRELGQAFGGGTGDG
jgi:hypothetical protein